MNSICSYLLGCLFLATACGQLHAQKTSATDEMDKEYAMVVRKAEEEKKRTIEEAKAKYVKDLNTALIAETKAGNLDAAIAIRDRIKSLSQSADLSKKLLGTKWVNSNGGKFEWTSDGRLLHFGIERQYFVVSEDSLAIVFGFRHIDELRFNKEITSFEQFNCKHGDKPIYTGRKETLK